MYITKKIKTDTEIKTGFTPKNIFIKNPIILLLYFFSNILLSFSVIKVAIKKGIIISKKINPYKNSIIKNAPQHQIKNKLDSYGV